MRHSHGKTTFLASNRSWSQVRVKYSTDLPPPYHSKLFLQVLVWSCIASNFDKGWRGDHKHKIMDGPFMPKYSTVSQVLLQLVVTFPFGFGAKKYPIFRAVFDSCSLFFAPKLHRNACYAG